MNFSASLDANFKPAEVEKALRGALLQFEQAIINRLIRVGENFVKNARTVNTYKDQTGNLRSSIGYIILKDGSQLAENFKTSSLNPDGSKARKKKGGGGEGVERAKEAAAEVAASYPTGYVLICVAGMEYAAAVEAKGYDVITGSSLIAKEELKKSLATLRDKLLAA
jgi:hypothetical protein